MLMIPPPDIQSGNVFDVWDCIKLALKARGLGDDVYDQIRILTQSAAEFLDRWFESEPLKATLATDGTIGAFAGPYSPGTAYVLMHHVMGESFGKKGVWAYVRGGMGGLAEALKDSYEEAGGCVIVNSPVEKILINKEGACGIAMKSGLEINTKSVVSGIDLQHTFIEMLDKKDLPGDFRKKVENISYDSATVKINLALGGVPNFKCLPSPNGPASHHHGTMHINSYDMQMIEDAYLDAKHGIPSRCPMIECTMASVLDETIAPEGKQAMSIFVQYAPMDSLVLNIEEKKFVDICIASIEREAPGFTDLIEDMHVITPERFENVYGLTGGNLFHGAMTLDQLFFMRPLPECSRYATPVRNLFLCGSATHPGGGIMGACGYNAAQVVLGHFKK